MKSISSVVLALLALQSASTAAPETDPLPKPPCAGAEPSPAWPDPDHSPIAKAWDRARFGGNWVPPACTGWTETGFSTLVSTAARFHYSGGAQGLLQRIGAISELGGVRYWSTTHQKWQTLILSAFALEGAGGTRHRRDFQPADLTTGQLVYYQQEDSLTGKATYQMRIVTASPERLVVDTRNVSTMRYFMVPVFHPGDVQSISFLDRESPEVWRYYNLTRTGKNSNSLAAGHEASSINRAVALYRHLAGIPTDKEPPFDR